MLKISALSLFLALTAVSHASAQGQRDPSDAQQLKALHDQLIQSHLDKNVDLWMSIEDGTFVSVNNGRVSHPDSTLRRAQRESYLGDAEFTIYRDLREPIITVSNDGSLGWLIAEVEVEGTMSDGSGGREPFHDIWAWVELYEKTGNRWRLVGNASNNRPGK